MLNLEIEKLIRKFTNEIDESLKNHGFKIKDITFDVQKEQKEEVLKIRITKN